MKGPWLSTLRRALLAGLGFALALGAADALFFAGFVTKMGMPAFPMALLRAGLATGALAVALSLLLLPLLRLPRGGWVHGLALAGTWLVLARVFAMDPNAIPMWLGVPSAAILLFGLGRGLARRLPVTTPLLGLALWAVGLAIPVYVERRLEPPAPARADASGKPDVLMVVIDTVRAESMSVYGYARGTTPTFEQLATSGAVWWEAMAPSTWSLPSHAALFTGTFPSFNAAHDETKRLGATPPTLADVLSHAGYETRCFTANPHISDNFGLTRGFQHSEEVWRKADGSRGMMLVYRVLDGLGLGFPPEDKGGAEVVDHYEDWVAARPAGARPAFVFINLLEAHFPFDQLPEEHIRRYTDRPASELAKASALSFGAQFGRELSDEERASMEEPIGDLYDAGVRYTDALLGRIIDATRAGGRLDQTVLVVLSDHGEMVGEHGHYGHGAAMYQQVLHVPLLIRYPPAIAQGVRPLQPVSTVGVYATVLDLLGLEAPLTPHVGSLLPTVDGFPGGQPMIAERYRSDMGNSVEDPMARIDRRYRVYRSGALKLVRATDQPPLLYDLDADPLETTDIAASRPEDLFRVSEELEQWQKMLGLPGIDAVVTAVTAAPLDDETRQRLEALGYIQ